MAGEPMPMLRQGALPQGNDAVKLRTYLDSRLDSMRQERMSWWTHWRAISDFLLPRRYKWFISQNQANRGSQMNQHIINSMPVKALRDAAAGMMAGITSPARPWFRMTLQDPDLAQWMPARLWCDDVTERMRDIIAHSNYYAAMRRVYLDLLAFGTSCMPIYEDRESVFRCYVPVAGEYFLSNSARLEVDTMGLEFVKTARQIVQEFGADAVRRADPTILQLQQESGYNQDKEFVLGSLVEPNSERIEGAVGIKGMAYRQTIWSRGQGGDQGAILRMRGFHENPFIAPRWDTVANDAYGTDSPGMDALGDLIQLQVEERRKAEAIEKHVRPPLLASIELQNKPLANVPGGITFVSKIDPGVGMKPVYEVMPDLAEMRLDLTAIEERLSRNFFVDLFRIVSNLETVRTATEVIQRREEALLLLGPVLERLHDEALSPALNRIFAICSRAGLLPPPPREIAGAGMTIEYTSMFDEAQKAASLTALERSYTFVGSLSASNPDARDLLNDDLSIPRYIEGVGAPAAILRSPQQLQQIRQQRAKQQEAAQMAQLGMAGVEAAKGLSDIDVGGGQSAVQAMLGSQPAPQGG